MKLFDYSGKKYMDEIISRAHEFNCSLNDKNHNEIFVA